MVALITQRAVIDRILDHLRRARDAARRRFTEGFAAAMRSLDGGFPVYPVSVRYSAEALRGATPMVRPLPGSWFGTLAQTLGPLAPALRGVAGVVAPFVGRAALRFR